MKTTALFFLLFISFNGFCQQTDEQVDPVKKRQIAKNNKIKMVKMFKYVCKNGIVSEKGRLFYQARLDTSGNLLSRIWFNPDKSQDLKVINKYKKGRMIQHTIQFTEGGVFDTTKSIEDFDASGRVTRSCAEFAKEEYKYDEKGNLAERISYQKNLITRDDIFRYQFDSLGNKIEMKWYDKKTNKISRYWWTARYDKNGNQTEYTVYKMDGKINSFETYTYDNDILLEEKYYDDKNEMRIVWKYEYEYFGEKK